MRIVGHRFFPIVVLALLGTAAYWNSLHAPFVFDDLDSIQRNGSVRFQDYLRYNPALYLQPRSLLFLTFAFNQWLSGQNVFSYHIINLFLHVISGLLVFVISLRIFRNLRSSSSPSFEASPCRDRASSPVSARE